MRYSLATPAASWKIGGVGFKTTRPGRRSGFDRHQPRDRQGRWVETGAEIRWGAHRGRVLDFNSATGRFRVERTDGTVVTLLRSQITTVDPGARRPESASPPVEQAARPTPRVDPSPHADAALRVAGYLQSRPGGSDQWEQDLIDDEDTEEMRKAFAESVAENYRDWIEDEDEGPANREKLRRGVQETAGGDIHMRVGIKALESIAENGRFRSLHEQAGRKDPDYTQTRRAYEEGVMELRGVPDDQMPLYGYVGDPGQADGYGDIVITFRSGVRNRTSVTGGDSLNEHMLQPYGIEDVAAGRLTDGQMQVFVGIRPSTRLVMEEGFGPSSYMEAQIHGGTSISDIGTVTIPPDLSLSPEARERLERAGVRVIQLEEDPFAGLTDEQLEILGVRR